MIRSRVVSLNRMDLISTQIRSLRCRKYLFRSLNADVFWATLKDLRLTWCARSRYHQNVFTRLFLEKLRAVKGSVKPSQRCGTNLWTCVADMVYLGAKSFKGELPQWLHFSLWLLLVSIAPAVVSISYTLCIESVAWATTQSLRRAQGSCVENSCSLTSHLLHN